jgi:hypothetical protein
MDGRHERPEEPVTPPDDRSKTIERKVTACTLAATALGGLLAVLNAVQNNPGLIAGLPKEWQSIIFIVVPLILIFATGWTTPSNRI